MKRRIVLLLAVWPLLASAEVYRWVDKQGQVHYTQEPPRQGEYDSLGGAAPPGSSPNVDALNQSIQATEQELAKQREQADKDAANQATRDVNCKRGRERLAFLDSRPPTRLARYDDKGNPVRMSEEDHAKERAAAEDVIRQSCE